MVKTDMRAGAAGVKILRKRADLLRYVNRMFTKRIIHNDGDSTDHEWGSILFQEYLEKAREWRTIRLGDSYFAYERIIRGDFHSGSHSWNYERPKSRLLDMVKNVTDKG